jgi:phage regulator Rha-like protein
MSKKTKKLELIVIEHEPRVDSRLMADRLGIKHKNFLETIKKHEITIKEFGQLPFETEVGGRSQGGGNPQKYTFLNEDQSVFVLTLSRNTEQVVTLKANLTREFARYRKMAMKQARAIAQQGRIEWQQARDEGKVERRELTDAIQSLVELANEQNPSNNADNYYTTFTRMVVSLLFNVRKDIKNLRDQIPASALRRLQMVESVVATWLNEEVDRKPDYHAPYGIIKERTRNLVDVIGQIDLSVPQGA